MFARWLAHLQNPETGEWKLHQANTVIEQPCIEYDSMIAKYDKWVELWNKYKGRKQDNETEI